MNNGHGREPVNAVIYCRVSRKEQVSNLSLDTQQQRCAEFCDQHGWQVLKIFKDEGESAKTTDRRQFQAMLTFCRLRTNQVRYVVVHDLSRFSRQLEDQILVLGDLRGNAIELRSVSENLDETAAGKLMRNIYGAFNQFDNDRKSERTKLGMQRAVSLGRYPHQAPLGYLNAYSKTGPHLIADPERAPLVRKAFEMFATGAETKLRVLQTVNALGLRTVKGKKITPQTFDRMLRNELYAGWICSPKWNLRERGSFEPLVSEEVFGRVQDILAGRRVALSTHTRNHPDFPLRVFVLCGACGVLVTGSWPKGRNNRYSYYRCRNSRCKRVNVRTEKLEAEFVEFIRSLSPDPSYLRLFREIVTQVWRQLQADSESILRATYTKLHVLGERKQRLVDFFLDGKWMKKPTRNRWYAWMPRSKAHGWN